jgi:hypothetical protein
MGASYMRGDKGIVYAGTEGVIRSDWMTVKLCFLFSSFPPLRVLLSRPHSYQLPYNYQERAEWGEFWFLEGRVAYCCNEETVE